MLPKYLQEYIEDHVGWIDRIGFVGPTSVALELSLENCRDDAVKNLDGRIVDLSKNECCSDANNDDEDNDGGASFEGEDPNRDAHKATTIEAFVVTAAPTTAAESGTLLRVCASNGKGSDMNGRAEGHNEPSTLGDGQMSSLTAAVHFGTFRIHQSREGGTGASIWRGGALLARTIRSHASLRSLFANKAVLELGAGCAALPSLTLGAAAAGSMGRDGILAVPPKKIVASDSMDEVLADLRTTLNINALDDRVVVLKLDFYRPPHEELGRYDVVMYADAVYSVEQGQALAGACRSLVRQKGGVVLGILPPFRVGVSEHLAKMKKLFGEPDEVDIASDEDCRCDRREIDVGCDIKGGGSSGYRLFKWKTC